MDGIRDLKIEFQDLLEQVQDDLKSLVLCALRDEPDEYTTFKAEINLKNAVTLKYFYVLAVRKCIEQSVVLHELKKEKNEKAKIAEAKNIYRQYTNFVDYVQKEITPYFHDEVSEHGMSPAFWKTLFNEVFK